MKTKYLLLSTLMLISIAGAVFSQNSRTAKRTTVKKNNDISNVLRKPVYESTVDSLNTKVWIISQKANTKMKSTTVGKAMGKMKDKNTLKDTEIKEAIATGTHYLIFDVTNILNKKEVADTSAKVEIVSPTKKILSVHLQPMMNHFGGGVTLDEKGEYLFTINLNVGMGYRTTQFKYRVK
jgi:hypothetical protein